jgi:hypothetical protein
MGRRNTLGIVVAACAATALLTATAVAGNPHNPGTGGPPASPGTPPGQAKKGTNGQGNGHAANAQAKGKAKQGGAPVSRGNSSHPAHPSHPAKLKPSHPAKLKPSHAVRSPQPARPVAPSRKPAFAASKGRGHEKTAHHKVLICHRTGSATNPYVVINVSINGWLNGHSKHPSLDGRSDILLKDPAAPGEKADPALVAARCGAGERADAAAVTTSTSSTTSTPLSGAVSTTRPSHRLAAMGVKGVSTTIKQTTRKPARAAGGVLGAISAPVRRGELPFTGFQLWIAALVAGGLVGGGLLLRRRTRVLP